MNMRLKENLRYLRDLAQVMVPAAAIFGGAAWWLTPPGAPASAFWWNLLRVFGWLMGGYVVVAGLFIAIMMWSGRNKGP